MDSNTLEIEITGIVQGVGFRPYLFNLARDLDLKGYILNRGNAGVRLVLQGKKMNLKSFLEKLRREKPSIAFIENVKFNPLKPDKKYAFLEIKKSEQGRGISLTLPPDVAMCENCLKDMRNPEKKRYYNYPFVACAVCGPRYTTVKELPYDRIRTTMNEFPFCDYCQKEYSNFDNRRFHAQTFSCSICGPHYKLFDKNQREIPTQNTEELLLKTTKKIKEGKIGAIKGIGGVHLVCLATNDNPILNLRNRKGDRKFKPFAVMVPNLNLIRNDFKISKREENLLNSFRRPIVLLEKNKEILNLRISRLVAPGLNNIGFMLPYSGIHHLIFDYLGEIPLIYTSGNTSHTPMPIKNEEILSELDGIADFFLLHNRTIHQRVDDSVLRVHDLKKKLIRRSRGYIPEYFSLPFESKVPGAIATGPELNVTGAILRKNRIFPTQHIGNVTRLETYNFLKEAILHMKKLLQIKDSEIRFISVDAHPIFESTKLGRNLSELYNAPIYPIQHHFAHLLGLMAENNISPNEKIIGISTDGVGYGEDGNIWGGEILLTNYDSFKRLGHLQYQPMIGGDRCTIFPARMVASILLNSLGIKESKSLFKSLNIHKDLEYGKNELNLICKSFKDSENSYNNIPLTSSTGRIFDSVSYLLGACSKKTYQGEPAMRLEGLAHYGNPDNVNLEIEFKKNNNVYIINTNKLIIDIIKLTEQYSFKKKDIAAKFQLELGKVFAEISIKLADSMGIKYIGLTGGVSYNYKFSNIIKKVVENAGKIFLEHDKIAPGDAGISVGQIIGGFFKYQKENMQ
jgi:hydrogenase maturation protein HypF